jgi:hypothetical protein
LRDVIGKTCPYCQTPIKPEESAVFCSACSIPHHQECWNEGMGCTTFGCNGRPTEPSTQYGQNNSATIDIDFNTDTKRCSNCGLGMSNQAVYCSRCGTRIVDIAAAGNLHIPHITATSSQYNPGVDRPPNTRHHNSRLNIITIVLIVLLVFTFTAIYAVYYYFEHQTAEDCGGTDKEESHQQRQLTRMDKQEYCNYCQTTMSAVNTYTKIFTSSDPSDYFLKPKVLDSLSKDICRTSNNALEKFNNQYECPEGFEESHSLFLSSLTYYRDAFVHFSDALAYFKNLSTDSDLDNAMLEIDRGYDLLEKAMTSNDKWGSLFAHECGLPDKTATTNNSKQKEEINYYDNKVGDITNGGYVVPQSYEIAAQMRRTVEKDDPSTHFTPDSTPITVSDGYEGWITAVHGHRYPTADGYGHLIFFWHNDKFLGWDAIYESLVSHIVDSGTGYFEVSYAQYATNDSLADPSLADKRIIYKWDGSSLKSSGSPPENTSDGGKKIYVKYMK